MSNLMRIVLFSGFLGIGALGTTLTGNYDVQRERYAKSEILSDSEMKRADEMRRKGDFCAYSTPAVLGTIWLLGLYNKRRDEGQGSTRQV